MGDYEKSYAMVGTGDADADRKALAQFALGNERMANGMCPNGCQAMLVTTDDYIHECPVCKFVLCGSMGENLKHA
jgi:hypothetical protein